MKKKILMFIVLLMLGFLLAIKSTYAWTNVPDTNKYALIDIIGGEQLASSNIYSIGLMNDFNSASVWYYEIVYYSKQPFVIYNTEAINTTYLLWFGLSIDTDEMFYADTTDWFGYYNHQYILNTNNKTTMDNIVFYNEYSYGVNMQIYFGIDNQYTLSTPVIVAYLEDILTDLTLVNVTYDDFMLSQFGASYTDGYNSGYSSARKQYGSFSGGTWLTADDMYLSGIYSGREQFGMFHSGEWLTASAWGNLEYNRGLSNDFDYFEWMYTALSLPALVLNIEIWPSFKLGYFVLASVIFALIAWVIRLGRRGL